MKITWKTFAPLVVWLGSVESRDVSGRVFEIQGGQVRVAQGWRQGAWVDKGARWEPEELGSTVRDLIARTPPGQKIYGG